MALHFYPALENFSNWTARNQKPRQSRPHLLSASPPSHYRTYSTGSNQQNEQAEQNAFFPGIDEAEVRAESAAFILLCVCKAQLSLQPLFMEKLTSPATVFLSMQRWKLMPFFSGCYTGAGCYCICVCLLRYCDWIKTSNCLTKFPAFKFLPK